MVTAVDTMPLLNMAQNTTNPLINPLNGGFIY